MTDDYFQYEFSFSQEQVNDFAELSGDKNPIHLDEEYAKTTFFGRRIIHGYLGASIFSKVFGTLFPGIGTIYLKQNLSFYAPMYTGENYKATFKVQEIIPDKSRALVETIIFNDQGKKVIVGEALIQHEIYGK